MTALANELDTRPGDDEVLLVLDDYHLIDVQQVHTPLMFLLQHRPAALHLILATRSDPPLPLARLRADRQLAELRADDLRFTAGEAATLLREAAVADLPSSAVTALTARTEGWAAGLQLAALSLRGQADPAGFVAAFSGSHRYILDYLTGEVLDQQSEQVREFLLETAVLERLSGGLCDAVTGRDGSQRMLAEIERAGLFLIPLDEVRGWWRYHHLFADLLRARLQHERPDRVPALHRAAAAWCAGHDLADEAVRHALAADAVWAAQLIERHFDATFLPGDRVTIQRWLAALPADLVRSRPRLSLAQAWMALTGGDVAAVEGPLDAAENAFTAARAEPFEPSVSPPASLLTNIPAAIALDRAYLASLRGDAGRTAAAASRMLAELGDGEWLLEAWGRWHLGLAEALRGRLDEAEHAQSASIDRWLAAGERYLAIRSCHHLGQVQRARGRLNAAVETYQRALEVAAETGAPARPSAGVGQLGLAQVAYQRNEFSAALQYLSEGIPRCRQLSYTQPLATGLATLAWIRQAQGDPAGAMDAIGEATRAAPSSAVNTLFNPVPAQRARLLLAQGDLAEASRWTTEAGLSAEDEPDYPREPGHLVLVRILLAQDRPGPALALLDRLRAAATAQDRLGSLIEIGALRALALAASGAGPAAVAELASALVLACPEGYVRVFADEGQPMAVLISRLIAAQRTGRAAARVPLGCLARLQRAFGTGPDGSGHRPGAAAPVQGIIEPLTSREMEVLQLLAAGRSNQAIARELVVSLDTVKKHVSHILGKLGAASRTEAVARARQLALIA